SVQAEPGMAGQPLLVRAPGTGKVLRVLLKSAGPVAAGTPLVEIGDTSNLEVSADLLSSDAAVVRVGAKAVVTGWGGEQAIAGSVRRIDPAAFTKVSALGLEEQRVPVVVDLKPPIPGALGHDYRVDVAIVTWDGQGILQLPATALFRDGEQWAVFLARGGRAHKTVVQLGPSDGTSTFVKDGVGEGDVIVTQPSDAIQDGTRIVELK
ncbi:MAG TPA: HlyD family efflux transporter periplasmic adaptor subunit, partial [Polyangia bacterium]